MGGPLIDFREIEAEVAESGEVLSYFETRRRVTLKRYVAFVREGIPLGEALGVSGRRFVAECRRWTGMLSMRRREIGVASDPRILGRGILLSG